MESTTPAGGHSDQTLRRPAVGFSVQVEGMERRITARGDLDRAYFAMVSAAVEAGLTRAKAGGG